MERTKRLRRVGILCSSFVRNYAYYKAGWNGDRIKVTTDFGRTINSNFLDISVLEWLKLFGSKNDHHHWKQVAKNSDEFKEKMFLSIGVKQKDLNDIYNSMKVYRDKFVAHLDSEEVMKVPKISGALPYVYFYYREIQGECDRMVGLPSDIEEYFNTCIGEANSHYAKISQR